MRKLLVSILLLIYSAFAFMQATFAWISLSTQNTLDGMEMTVTMESGMEISLDGENFYPQISEQMLRREIGNIIKLDSITSIDGISFQKNYAGNAVFAVGNKDYITFDLWFRTSIPTTKYLYLVENVNSTLNYDLVQEKSFDGTYVVSKGVEWVNQSDFDNGDGIILAGTRKTYYAAEAMRMSFVEKRVEASLLGQDDERTDLITKIYDPSENEARSFGKEYGFYSYYLAQHGENSLKLPTVYPDTIYHLTTFKNPYEAFNNTSQIAAFQKGVTVDGVSYLYAKVRVNIWLEGWDADCIDAIFADSVMMQLKFRGARLASE